MESFKKEANSLVFLLILLVIMIVAMILFFLKINIEISNLKFSSQAQRHLNKDYEITIRFYSFGFLPIFKMHLSKSKLEKMRVKEKIKDIDFSVLEKSPSFDQEIVRAIKKLNMKIKNINLHIDLGTENASLTSIIVPAISTIISIVLRKTVKKFENQIFIIHPVYQNQNLVNLSISGIFEIKMRHIINIIYIFIKKEKKGVKEYERTSNRRPYDYSYE